MVSTTERLIRDRDFSFVLCRSIESWSPDHPLFPVWQSVQPSIIDLARKCLSYDRNGINLYWASDPVQEYRSQNLVSLAQMFQHKNPPITNNLLGAMEKVITYYFSRRDWKLNVNGEIVIVLLDQVPPESERIVELMLDTSQKLGTEKEEARGYELGILFIQVGEDEAVRQFLNFLDDDLEKLGAHDLIDAKHWSHIGKTSLSAFLEGALVD